MKPSSPAKSAEMRKVRARDTKAERRVRSELHRLGLRYALQRPIVTGTRRTVDIVFVAERIAVFIDGCYWHACPEHATWPKANAAFWRAKILGNVERDRDTDERLRAEGWLVLRYWEHEDPCDVAADVLVQVMRRRRAL